MWLSGMGSAWASEIRVAEGQACSRQFYTIVRSCSAIVLHILRSADHLYIDHRVADSEKTRGHRRLRAPSYETPPNIAVRQRAGIRLHNRMQCPGVFSHRKCHDRRLVNSEHYDVLTNQGTNISRACTMLPAGTGRRYQRKADYGRVAKNMIRPSLRV